MNDQDLVARAAEKDKKPEEERVVKQEKRVRTVVTLILTLNKTGISCLGRIPQGQAGGRGGGRRGGRGRVRRGEKVEQIKIDISVLVKIYTMSLLLLA